MEAANKFQELRNINVNQHVEKKGRLSYLSWVWAVDTLLQADGSATWEYAPPMQFGETLMVFCSVHAFGKTMTAQLPVMNNVNKSIRDPDSMAVNTAMQRCLAKAIALHGIGLYIYAGEDLPDADKESAQSDAKQESDIKTDSIPPMINSAKSVSRDTFESLDAETQEWLRDHAMIAISYHVKNRTDEAFYYLESLQLDVDMKVAISNLFDAPMRSALKNISTTKKAA